ncbi:hypothetical protein JTE90_007755 [Oedothorax gibbosus]|uniref:ENPP1-3/EXOG-like endonuclease/phosphodiesterase domain-containing protein n=1 Tax=Oedothorax gibbosus TaxID=931172 RepID=A0AAV6UA20_9ARAC|nr:hypothetical protein JTE90_007755 [Oedothorax gibbosus]
MIKTERRLSKSKNQFPIQVAATERSGCVNNHVCLVDERSETMELTRTDERDDYHRINGGTTNKFGAKKIVVVVVGVSALVLVVVLIAVFSQGFPSKKDPLLDIPELQWEGDCPVEHECPDSFKGSLPPLLLVSLDGFRPDYLWRGNLTPTLRQLAKCGVHAEYMNPVYPSKTFPNHYTQVTGLYPESHGIIDNSMYDPDTGKTFKLGDPATFDPEWWQREPIWVSAEKQGKRTATFFWPGSDVSVNGTRPTYYKKYSSQVPFESRVVQVLEWLDLPPPHRPAFLTLYFNEPDKQAHHHGTTSKEVDAALVRVDRLVLALFSGLQARNLTGCVNVFIASDHGMADISCDRVVDVRKYLNMSTADVHTGTFGRVRPKDNSTTVEELESQLRCRSEHLRVFEKEHLPVRMHYRDNRRIEPIILDTDAGWTIFKEDYLPSHKWCTGGAHGYDHFFPDMRAFFTAVGPSMKKNTSVEPFLNIELYELMCELIDITPNPNNGTRGSLHHFLRQPLRPLAPKVAPVAPLEVGQVAKDAAEYAKRVAEARCPCQPSPQSNPETDSDLRRHLPFGVPTTTSSDAEVRLLRNVDYDVGFDERRHMTMWAAFTLGPENQFEKVTPDVCWTGDARVNGSNCPNNETLIKNDLVQWPLYPPTFSSAAFKDAAAYVTNSIIVSHNFSKVLGDEVWRRLLETEATPIMNIITGPAFVTPTSMRKMDDDGLVVPSHFFVIATRCSSDDRQPIAACHPSKLRSSAYLIPSHPYTDNCEAAERIIFRNRARVADIEGATGLEFFSGLPQYDAIRLRTALP